MVGKKVGGRAMCLLQREGLEIHCLHAFATFSEANIFTVHLEKKKGPFKCKYLRGVPSPDVTPYYLAKFADVSCKPRGSIFRDK
jgi:hypothetical protein